MRGHVELECRDSLALVTLSQLGKLNAMSRAMWRELKQVFETLQTASVRCVVVRGEGGNFCAGGDIAEYPDFRFSEATLRDFHENEVWGGLQAMLNCDVPVVAQIDGVCMGAGLEIVACCDVRIGAASARFGAPIAKLGFPMALRELQLLLRTAGELTTRELLLEAVVLDASTLLLRGFLTRVVGDAQVADAVLQSALRIARLGPHAARMNKQAIRILNQTTARSAHAPEAIEKLSNAAYFYADSAEHKEGIAAFLDKRQPNF